MLMVQKRSTHLSRGLVAGGNPPRGHCNQSTHEGRREEDDGEHQDPGERAEVAGPAGGGADQHVEGGAEQTQQVEGQREQRRRQRDVHDRLPAQRFRHGQQEQEQHLEKHTERFNYTHGLRLPLILTSVSGDAITSGHSRPIAVLQLVLRLL